MANDIVLGSELGPEFLLGTETPDKITVSVDGTSVTKSGGVLAVAPPTFANNVITFPASNGAAPTVVDLSQFTTDIHVSGGSFDAATSVLTLTDTDGSTPDIVIDLSTLLGVSTQAGNALTDGPDGKPFLPEAFADDAVTAYATANNTDLESLFGTAIATVVTA